MGEIEFWFLDQIDMLKNTLANGLHQQQKRHELELEALEQRHQKLTDYISQYLEEEYPKQIKEYLKKNP